MIPKNIWINSIIESLKEIASEEYQVKGWVKNEINACCTFVETCYRPFDDIDIAGFFEHAKEFGFSDIRYNMVFDACKAFKDFSNKYTDYEDSLIIFNDLELQGVRKLANEALWALGISHYLHPSKATSYHLF